MLKQIEAYLTIRRMCGYKLREEERILRQFAHFASKQGITHVRKQTALQWAADAKSPRQRERRLRMLVAFARHARSEDSGHEVPAAGVFAAAPTISRIPHIFSIEDLRRLLMAASELGPDNGFRPWIYHTLFGLLACTGMRISEALALRVDDVTTNGLMIRETKFRKSRLLPLHETTIAELDRYRHRRAALGSASDRLFLASHGRPLCYTTVISTFLFLLRHIGLHPGPGHNGPRLHDLRHTFAVRCLEAVPESREHVGIHMRALSTYLGHYGIAQTYRYLQATPQLMKDIADACEKVVERGVA
jgi:integrase